MPTKKHKKVALIFELFVLLCGLNSAKSDERLPKRQPFLIIEMVGTTGFEPATSRTPSVRATRLRHVPFALNSTTTIQDLLFRLVSCSSSDNNSRSSEASCFNPCRSSAVRGVTARV